MLVNDDETETVFQKIGYIAKQFLCNIPTKQFQWKNIVPDLDHDLQDILLRKTVKSEIVQKYPIHPHYQKAFLKILIENLEKQGKEIHDELYNAYGKLVAKTLEEMDYFKHYIIENSQNIVSLEESNNLISGGTTGLRTWQAAVALSEWILQNSSQFENQNILELGSGVGLTGLTFALECKPNTVYLTDCHEKVLEKLERNVRLNTSSCKVTETKNGNVALEVVNLPWEEVDEKMCLKLGKIDTVIAADIIYDDSLFDSLINALNNLSEQCSVEIFIFCCTERNPKTLQLFLNILGQHSFTYKELEVPKQRNFIWVTDTPIRILALSKM